MSGITQSRPVSGSSAISGSGNGHGNGGAGGAKNLRQKSRCHKRRLLNLATYNTRTLRTDDKIHVLKDEIDKLNWSVAGLSEVRRQGEDTIILNSDYLFYHQEGEHLYQGGVAFLIHKSLVNNMTVVGSVYPLKVIQVYAPASAHPDNEVEVMYEDVSRAIRYSNTHFTVVVGDFNARLGARDGEELKVKKKGPFGIGQRKHRGHLLANFLEREDFYMMNSFFKKKPQRMWTWISPNGFVKSEIDFILAEKPHIFNDVSVISRFKTGSDHRMVRSILNINVKLDLFISFIANR